MKRTAALNFPGFGNKVRYNTGRIRQFTESPTHRMTHVQLVMSWIAVCLVTFMTVLFFGIILYRGLTDEAWLEVAKAHFAAVVGLPAAAVGSLFLVIVLRISEGPITVNLGSWSFDGASAPIAFWILCFLAMAYAIKLLWKT